MTKAQMQAQLDLLQKENARLMLMVDNLIIERNLAHSQLRIMREAQQHGRKEEIAYLKLHYPKGT